MSVTFTLGWVSGRGAVCLLLLRGGGGIFCICLNVHSPLYVHTHKYKRSHNVVVMLGHRRGQWPNITPTLW